MHLRLGTDEPIDATAEGLDVAVRNVGRELEFFVLEDDDGRFMQFNGVVLEACLPPRLYRARDARVVHDALRSFLEGDTSWLKLTRWDDVTRELTEQRPVLQWILLTWLFVGLIGFLLWLLFGFLS